MRLAFIGLGRMGSGMARNLLRAGHEVTLYNRSREKAEAIGAPVGDTPADACRYCDAAITMLADDPAVEQVVFGDRGIPDSVVHIGCSTISTALPRRLTNRGRYISAPVFGRPEAAEAKKLLLIPAGPPDLGTRLRARIDNIPAGARIFVSTQRVAFSNGVASVVTTGAVARLVANESAAFAPLAATATLDGIAAGELTVNGGSATAVWEMLRSDPTSFDTVDFVVWVQPGVGGRHAGHRHRIARARSAGLRRRRSPRCERHTPLVALRRGDRRA
jgi:hypothetical protein